MTDIVSDKVVLAPLYHLELVRERDVPYHQSASTTEEAAQVLHQVFDRVPTEQMMVMYLNSGSRIIGIEKVGMGGIERVGTEPQEIFRGAIVKAAPEIILSHNHPDEEVEPSVEDIIYTMKLVDLGALLGLRVRDHIVVGINNKHMSIRENMDKLTDKFREAEHRLYHTHTHTLDVVKELLAKLAPTGQALPDLDTPKKSGNPKANASDVDWKQSLSYLILSGRK